MIPPTPNEYVTEIHRLEALHSYCIVRMSFLDVMAIIGGLQLALRHPNFPATSKQLLTEWIEQMAEQLPSDVLRRTIAAGFNPECDV